MTAAARLPDFEDVARVLGWEEPAEIHGLLCGLLCVDVAMASDSWLARVQTEVSEDRFLKPRAEQLLLELFAVTKAQLSDDSLDFSLLLPEDEMNLSQRARSLGCWCQGFLSGLGLGGINISRRLPASIQEFLGDTVAISRVDSEITEADHDDEESYMELVEYLRMGVLLVSQEWRSSSNPAVPS